MERAISGSLRGCGSGPALLRWAGLEPLVAVHAIGAEGGRSPEMGGEKSPLGIALAGLERG